MAISQSFDAVSNPKQNKLSLVEAVSRLFVTRFLSSFISAGSLSVLEEGGTNLTFEGTNGQKKCSLKVDIRVHNPQFYWKVMTGAAIGLANAYIDGDFSFIDTDEGLVNFILLMIANTATEKSDSKKRAWWKALMLTSSITSIKLLCKNVLRKNSIAQAPKNISTHYDMGNEIFGLMLGETMQYSSGIFMTKDEDLKTAQMRKISVLIEKARVNEKHQQVLEIGCGWGIFAIEIVKRTGCKYTGITLSQEQLKFAELKVKEAGLQDNIKIQLCDYRKLPKTNIYDRIISCEMIEHVGHEYMEEFFGCCESLLAEDGLLVLQFSSVADQDYDEYRRSSTFMREYIFPGGCLPSLSRVTSAMNTASRFCVEHLENVGSHYYQTLRHWRKNLLDNQNKIVSMGFDDKFIRTLEFYFGYCAAGFKAYTIRSYHVVFSRPGNIETLGFPYKGFPSAYSDLSF